MFQFGTRPLLTQESPISDEWKKKLFTLKEGDVSVNKFSPTGFWSSAVDNSFLQELKGISERQVPFSRKADETFTELYPFGRKGIYLGKDDFASATEWAAQGYTKLMLLLMKLWCL